MIVQGVKGPGSGIRGKNPFEFVMATLLRFNRMLADAKDVVRSNFVDKETFFPMAKEIFNKNTNKAANCGASTTIVLGSCVRPTDHSLHSVTGHCTLMNV